MERYAPMSVKQWLITLLIMCIPLVNIIMLFVWAFGSDDVNIAKKNWAKAGLILTAIGLCLTIILYGTLAALGVALLGVNGYL